MENMDSDEFKKRVANTTNLVRSAIIRNSQDVPFVFGLMFEYLYSEVLLNRKILFDFALNGIPNKEDLKLRLDTANQLLEDTITELEKMLADAK